MIKINKAWNKIKRIKGNALGELEKQMKKVFVPPPVPHYIPLYVPSPEKKAKSGPTGKWEHGYCLQLSDSRVLEGTFSIFPESIVAKIRAEGEKLVNEEGWPSIQYFWTQFKKGNRPIEVTRSKDGEILSFGHVEEPDVSSIKMLTEKEKKAGKTIKDIKKEYYEFQLSMLRNAYQLDLARMKKGKG